MVTCELFESTLIAPFIVMNDARDDTLARCFNHWNGSSKVIFHPIHWMDKEDCCLYLEWLRSCYAGEKLGLIWDAATSHFSIEVLKKTDDLDITLGAIPPGCTSFIQICGLIANKPDVAQQLWL